MATYTKVYNNPYPNGWKPKPDLSTPYTIEIKENEVDTFEALEDYLHDNPLLDISLSNLADGDTLSYDSTSSKFTNAQPSGGTTVVANPTGTATDDLETIQIGETIYDIPGGGGGNANIWTGTQAELEEVFDELEEGTQINITDDEQEVVEGGTIYSEDEQCIGLWIDKKPLYQKTIVIEPTSAETTVDVSVLSIDTLVKREGAFKRNTTPVQQKAVEYRTESPTNNNYGIISELRGTNLYVTIQQYTVSEIIEIHVTLTYTKTTDAPIDVVVGKSTMYIASSDCYSTEEKEVGVFVDGKPLYQKTIVLASSMSVTSNTWTDIDNGDWSFVDTFVLGFMVNANGASVGFVAVDKNTNNNKLRILQTRSTDITCKSITIQYTKTSDTVGSGTYTPASGKAVHYSTDEQVIGTWIDGSTLYRKVIPITANWEFVANTWVKSNIPKGNIKAMINGRIEIFYQDTYSLHFVQLGFVDDMIAGNSFRAFAAAANGANLILEYTKITD